MYIVAGPGFPVMYEQTVCTRYGADIFLALYLTNLDLRKESPVNLCTYECYLAWGISMVETLENF